MAPRLLALDKLGDRDTEAVADALLGQLTHPNRNLRERSLTLLAATEHGRAALSRATREAETAEQAWSLVRRRPRLSRTPRQTGGRIVRASRPLPGSRRPPGRPALIFAARGGPGRPARPSGKRAAHWRKKKHYPAALLYLRLLARDPACGFANRLELACCTLKHSARELGAEDRADRPGPAPVRRPAATPRPGAVSGSGKDEVARPRRPLLPRLSLRGARRPRQEIRRRTADPGDEALAALQGRAGRQAQAARHRPGVSGGGRVNCLHGPAVRRSHRLPRSRPCGGRPGAGPAGAARQHPARPQPPRAVRVRQGRLSAVGGLAGAGDPHRPGRDRGRGPPHRRLRLGRGRPATGATSAAWRCSGPASGRPSGSNAGCWPRPNTCSHGRGTGGRSS